MSATKPLPRALAYGPGLVEDLAEAVYRERLGETDAAAMVAKDRDGGVKLRSRAQAYAPIVRATLDALGRMQR